MGKKTGLLLYYLAFFICGLFIITFLYVAYISSVNLVAGREFLISRELILLGVLRAAHFLVFLTPVFLSIYKIRHLENPISSAVIYILLTLFTWLLLFPAVEMIQGNVNLQKVVEHQITENTHLSGGYFRKTDYELYYFLRNANDENADVLRIYPVGFTMHNAEVDKINISPASDFSRRYEPFKDPCIKESFDVIPSSFVTFADILHREAATAWSDGLVSWLFFCALGIALSSVYCYAGLSSWKLVNFVFIMLTEAVVLSVNILYFSRFGEEVRGFFERHLYGNVRLDFFSSRSIELPLCVFNLLVGIVVITVSGILKSVKRKKSNG